MVRYNILIKLRSLNKMKILFLCIKYKNAEICSYLSNKRCKMNNIK